MAKKELTLDEIIKLQSSEDWKDRFKSEFHLTLRRVKKLGEFINKYRAGKLGFDPNCPIQLFDMQIEAMCKYLDVLVIRAKLEGVDLYG